MTTKEKIKHLYWRAGFGMSPSAWEKAENLTLDQAINELFNKAKSINTVDAKFTELPEKQLKDLSKEEKQALRKNERKLVFRQNADWIQRMSNPSESALLEKMSLFWHGHFACITKGSRIANAQLNTIRKHALGNFGDLVHTMAKDVSMIRFLNNQQNRKQKPNENFARELMELFTIGRGNYTENDIKEAARAFTGWSSNFQGEFVFRKYQHDFGSKKFMGKKGKFNGDEIIEIILAQPETATFITRKIYRFFVNERVDEVRIQELAQSFYDSNYDIKKLMYSIFKSDWFYAPENVGVKIKSPVELIAGIMQTLQVTFDDAFSLFFIERALGQVLFNPPNVAGWPGGKAWIDNSTLMLRLNLVGFLFQAVDINFKVKEEFESKQRNKAIRKINADVNLNPLIDLFKNDTHQAAFEKMANYLLQPETKLNLSDFNGFVIKNNQDDFIKTLALRLMSLPEYQMC
jgi:uncharacterized protein (DUF1800 family)